MCHREAFGVQGRTTGCVVYVIHIIPWRQREGGWQPLGQGLCRGGEGVCVRTVRVNRMYVERVYIERVCCYQQSDDREH